jgi:(p)ppGpp synthase/HD superfamily hydrolase
MTISERYGAALAWAEQLHRSQRRKGKEVPYIAHLISVSAMVWEDGGDEDQAIAGLLHDAIEDAGQSHASIAERFGTAVADIVRDCTDTSGAVPAGGKKEPWLVRKTRYIASLERKPAASLLVTAADKAHNARDMVFDARRDPAMWSKFNAGLDGTAWYLLRMHQSLCRQLPGSRSVASLGESIEEILASEPYRTLTPTGIAPAVWAAGYAERCNLAVTAVAGEATITGVEN